MIPISFLKASDHLVTHRKLEIDVDGDYVNSSVMKTNVVKLEYGGGLCRKETYFCDETGAKNGTVSWKFRSGCHFRNIHQIIPISFLTASDHLVTRRKLETGVDRDYVNVSVMKTNLLK